MILYTRNLSNYCFKTEWALLELGIDFKRELNQGDQDATGMAKVKGVSPVLTTIPTLVEDDGFVLTESSAIVQYLVDARGMKTPFLPKDPKGRARVLQWDRFCDFHVAKALGTLFYNSPDYLKAVSPEVLPEVDQVEAAKREVPLLEQKLEAILSKQKYITSDKDFTYADVSLAANVFFLQWFDLKMTLPGVVRWLTECTARPAFNRRMEMMK